MEIFMNKTNTHFITSIFLSIACVGMTVESIALHWEFWVPPLIIGGLIALWVIHITQYSTDLFRENYYLIYGMMVVFFHGVHESSFFDIGLVCCLMLVTFTMLSRKELPRLILAEYVVIMVIQLIMVIRNDSVVFDALTLSRVVLHVAIVICTYLVCITLIKSRSELKKKLDESEETSRVIQEDMEDFLTNISHELRTPVNVVNGMSTIILNDFGSEEIKSIHNAGIRLSHQIEDIQDYTELKRGGVILEEEKYMILSLVNDMLASFPIQDKNNRLEFIIDLDPAVPTMLKGDIRKLHKIIRHLMDNAIKFTRKGGLYVRVHSAPREYGINLLIEVTDTGVGMSRKDISNVSKGFYQANKKRTRSTGGIGLGLNVVHGLVHSMNGFVAIESDGRHGSTVRVSIPQEIVDPTPCLVVEKTQDVNVVFYTMPDKYKVAAVRDFYRNMATNMAAGLHLNLYSASGLEDLQCSMKITHIFMGAEEYVLSPEIFDMIAEEGVIVAVSAPEGFRVTAGSRVIVMPKPLYGVPVVKVLNGIDQSVDYIEDDSKHKPMLDGVRALIVDDEPMNLVVAAGLFKQYGIITDTADGGRESVAKCAVGNYDLVFMDHMMPEMDGVEAMKLIKKQAADEGRKIRVVALTANVVSSAKEMFQREGFDGFIAKPIDIMEFERVMKQVLPADKIHFVRRDGQ